MSKLPSINELTAPLIDHLITYADALRCEVTADASGVIIVDAGINC